MRFQAREQREENSELSQEYVVRDVACTVCGCVCDDLQMTIADDRIVEVRGSCHLSEAWFLQQNHQRPPAALVDDRPAPLDAAIEHAIRLLSDARAPLVFGLSRSSTRGQRAAIRLADRIGACIDTTASRCHAPSIMAIQEVGESTCTLGEVRNRADLVVFWGVDPTESHPRHMQRYSVDVEGEFVPGGRRDRTVVVVDTQPTQTSARADLFLKVPAESQFELLWQLRTIVRGISAEAHEPAAMPADQVQSLAERMTSCRCGIVFFGLGLAQSESGHRTVEALLKLVAELNAHTRFHARRMRIDGDVAGADTVLCWQTGYPFAVNLNRGFPRYGPGEYSANELLERHEVDACLLVGSQSAAGLSPAALDHLRRIPTIALDGPLDSSPISPTVHITTATYGIHLDGTAYRMDEVPIPLRAVLTTRYPSDAEVLKAMSDRLPYR